MRYLIAGLLAYFAYGSVGLLVQDVKLYGRLYGDSIHAAVMAVLCLAGAACLIAGWGI